jgi:hypothetical protein
MSVELRPLRADEYDEWVRTTRAADADDIHLSGRAAMQLAEQAARERGLDRVELNVFGGNTAARGLYRSLGYDEVAVFMGKNL